MLKSIYLKKYVATLMILFLCFYSQNSFSATINPKTNNPTKKDAALTTTSDLIKSVNSNSTSDKTQRLIIKFKSDGAYAVKKSAAYLFNKNLPFKAETVDKSDSLDKINKQYGVKFVKALFRNDQITDIGLAKINQGQFIKGLAKKFPQRANRMNPNNVPDVLNTHVLEVPSNVDLNSVIAAYEDDPHVEYVTPDYKMVALFTPNDPYYSSVGTWGQSYDDLWGLKKITTSTAWDTTKGSGVVVAVVDTGVDITHPDLAANIWTNTGEIASNGIDDDSNGYIDDVNGYNFVSRNNNPADGHGHGTHVAGTIAAVGNNGVGIVGVAPLAKIMPVKGLSDSGSGYLSDLANGLIYAADNGANVINNSWGCSGRCMFSPTVEAAVSYAHNLGAVVVFAAGNSNDDVAYYSPANMRETISVAAFDNTDAKASFSNYGELIDVAAPGVDILSLNSNHGSNTLSAALPSNVVATDYLRLSGTSMAAPHVSGLVALLLANTPTLSNENIKQNLHLGSDDIAPTGFDTSSGYGRINATKALTTVIPAQAKITEPSSNYTLYGGNLVIKGTANGINFKNYQLFVKDMTKNAWVSLGPSSSIAVTNNLLGTFKDTLNNNTPWLPASNAFSSMADAQKFLSAARRKGLTSQETLFVLKLIVTANDGSTLEDKILFDSVAPSSKTPLRRKP